MDFLVRCVQVPVSAVGPTTIILAKVLAEKNQAGGFLP